MFYKWLFQLSDQWTILNVFKYISFRSFIVFFTTFLTCWWFGPLFINKLKLKQIGQSVRDDGPEAHFKKQGTPTMGGALMLIGVLLSSLLWIDLANPLILVTLLITFGFAGIGFWDDFLKVVKKNHKGLSGKLRLVLEFSLCLVSLYYLVSNEFLSTVVHFPFLKNTYIDLGYFYILFGSFVIVGCANAVNLTDGLDGLAIVPIIICSGAFLVFAYVAGHVELAGYLNIPYIKGAGELTLLSSSIIAAGLGFLWFNAYPAQVFMGDMGSLSLGGFLGILAVLTKNEILLVLLGGVFVVEALSVITQVVSYKLTGKRVFKMAPIHHHFELKGLTENKIIVRFWITSILLAALSLSTLKLR